MSNKKIKSAIDNILEEKKNLLRAKIDKAANNIISQLEEIKNLEEFNRYAMPDGLESGDGSADIGFIHKSIMKISTADNQLNLINNLLKALNKFCTRAGLFLVKEDKMVGWKGKGFTEYSGGIQDDEVKKVFISFSANTVFKQVLETKETYSGAPLSQPDDHLIFSRLGGENPDSIYVLPFFVKGKPQAVIYIDVFGGKKIGKKEIEMLSIMGEMSLDLLPLRQKILSKIKTREYVDIDEEPEQPLERPPDKAPESEFEQTGDDNEITLPSVKESDPERLSRVIINDIVLYNKKIVEEGRKKRALYKLLEDTIMQAKDLYLIKYSEISIFEKQLVRQLAKGDKEALKGYKFETL
ncbi:hypothetical protein ACFLRB_05435 [Acidobacteriota bacterium]